MHRKKSADNKEPENTGTDNGVMNDRREDRVEDGGVNSHMTGDGSPDNGNMGDPVANYGVDGGDALGGSGTLDNAVAYDYAQDNIVVDNDVMGNNSMSNGSTDNSDLEKDVNGTTSEDDKHKNQTGATGSHCLSYERWFSSSKSKCTEWKLDI